jgi:hypothetical protein
MSYLERYQHGEYVQVWEELIALGDRVREEPVYSDACAVARETMERGRRNIETIYQRLQSIGYQFEIERSPKKGPDQAADLLSGLRDQLAGDSKLESVFGRMLGSLETMSEQLNQMFPVSNQPIELPKAFTPPDSDIVDQLDAFEREIGKLPLSVRAWCEIVGSVDFVGDHPGLASYHRDASFDLRGMMRRRLHQDPRLQNTLRNVDEEQYRKYLENSGSPLPPDEMIRMHRLMREQLDAAPEPEKDEPTWFVSDPLVFYFHLDIDEANEMLEQQIEYGEEQREGFWFMVAPDVMHKANYSGGTYDIWLPEATADVPLVGADMHFVAYLRESFAWGGFPGLKDHKDRDEKLIAFLKEDLEPI